MITVINAHDPLDLFSVGAECLFNPVNCKGVSGKGLAKEFAQRFHYNQRCYVEHCRQGTLQLGRPLLVKDGATWVVNFPTKDHWLDRSALHDITFGMSMAVTMLQAAHIKSVAIPALGCGYGNLQWLKVRPVIVNALRALDGPEFEAWLFEPRGRT